MNIKTWARRKKEIRNAKKKSTGEATGLAKALSREVLAEMRTFVKGKRNSFGSLNFA